LSAPREDFCLVTLYVLHHREAGVKIGYRQERDRFERRNNMFNFGYFAPTKVVFGKDTELQVAALIRQFDGTKVLIHYGGGSVIRSGLMKRVTDLLEKEEIAYVMLGGAVPNPHLTLVYEGIELVKKERSTLSSPSAAVPPSIPARPLPTDPVMTVISGIFSAARRRSKKPCLSAWC